MRANCILFAVALWVRRRQRRRLLRARGVSVERLPGESYLVIRLSRMPWGLFHVLHGKLDRNTDQIKVISYKPVTPEKAGVELVFKGRVSRGDKRE